jgi:Rod binding domain-containing protein
MLPLLHRPATEMALPSFGQQDQLLQKTQAKSTAAEDAKIDKSATDFESLLITNWLQGAQESFAGVPGGDEEADADPGRGQLQSLAMQSLGTALTASGGIGLAHSIAKLLHKSDATSAGNAAMHAANLP